MTQHTHIQSILDTLIELEKHNPFKTLIDVDCGLAKWGFYLKLHLELNKPNLTNTPPHLLKLIGTKSNSTNHFQNHSLYDEIWTKDVAHVFNAKETNQAVDVLLFLNEYEGRMTDEQFEAMLPAVRNCILINLYENEECKWAQSLKKEIDKKIQTTSKSFTTKFELIEADPNILLLKRRFKNVFPIYTYEVIEKNEGYIVLHQPSSIAEYYIPDGTQYINIHSLKHSWSGELSVYIDGELYHGEVLEDEQTKELHIIQLDLPMTPVCKLTLKVNYSTTRRGNEAWIKEVQFS